MIALIYSTFFCFVIRDSAIFLFPVLFLQPLPIIVKFILVMFPCTDTIT